MKRRFWHRRWNLLCSYATVAVGLSGLVFIGGWLLLIAISHMVRNDHYLQ